MHNFRGTIHILFNYNLLSVMDMMPSELYSIVSLLQFIKTYNGKCISINLKLLTSFAFSQIRLSKAVAFWKERSCLRCFPSVWFLFLPSIPLSGTKALSSLQAMLLMLSITSHYSSGHGIQAWSVMAPHYLDDSDWSRGKHVILAGPIRVVS